MEDVGLVVLVDGQAVEVPDLGTLQAETRHGHRCGCGRLTLCAVMRCRGVVYEMCWPCRLAGLATR